MASDTLLGNTSSSATASKRIAYAGNAPSRAGVEGLLRRHDLWSLCLTAFIAMMLSKIGTLLPGVSPDDYFFASGGSASNATYTLIAQGRGLNAVLFSAINSLGTTFSNVYSFSFFLASGAISLAIAGSIVLVKGDRTNHLYHHIAAAFAATHPYLTSYFLFRMSLVNHAFVYVSLFAALWLIAERQSLWRQAACVLLLVVCSHVSQIILILFAISAGGWSLARFYHERIDGADFRRAVRCVVLFVAVLGLSTGLYFFSSTVARSIMHTVAATEYTPHLHGGVANTISTAFKLIHEVLLANESILPQWLKIWLLVVLAVTIGGSLVYSPLRGISCLILLACGLLVTVSTMALSWGGLVPRTFSPIGLCLALVFSLACSAIKPSQSRILSVAMAVPIVAFCFIGASLFYQQLMLTQWDQRTAVTIYDRFTQEVPEDTPIRIVAAWPFHTQPLSHNEPGINESAFLYSWTYPGLFAVATGAKLNFAAGERSMCNGVPAWPNLGSMKRLDDGSMLVCMVR